MASCRFTSTLAILLFAAAASADTVTIRFSGTTLYESTPRSLSGWLSYETPLPVVDYVKVGDDISYAAYTADDSASDDSYISWGLTIAGDLYSPHGPVDLAFHRDQIRVYDGTFGGGDYLEYFSGHLGGSEVTDQNSLFLTFGDTGGTQLDGWHVPDKIPTSGWDSRFVELITWKSGDKVKITGVINDVTVVPLPAAGWPALALLGGLALRRRFRRRRQS